MEASSVVSQTLTMIVVTPASASLGSAGTRQFTAMGYDQYNNPMINQPSFTWSNTGSGLVNSSGLYTASYVSGSAMVTASSGSVNGSASVTVTDAAPTVATAASASPGTVTGTTTALSVLGAGLRWRRQESNLTYTWAATSRPSGAPAPTYSSNGTNASKNTTATFSKAGAYTLQVTITDAGGLSTTSSVNVTVNQTSTSIAVTPGTANLGSHGTQQFAAPPPMINSATAMGTQPGFPHGATPAAGSVNNGRPVHRLVCLGHGDPCDSQ